MEFGKETFILHAEIYCHYHYGKQSIGWFGISSPRMEAIRVAPQPAKPTENIYYEIPTGMLEKLLANPYAEDGTIRPNMHLMYIDEICGLFKLAGLSKDGVNKKVSPLSLEVKALKCYRLLDDIGMCDWNRLKLEFHQKFYPMLLVHRD